MGLALLKVYQTIYKFGSRECHVSLSMRENFAGEVCATSMLQNNLTWALWKPITNSSFPLRETSL